MWGPIASGSDDKTKGVEAGGVEDPALSLLILRCATMIVQKVNVCFFPAYSVVVLVALVVLRFARMGAFWSCGSQGVCAVAFCGGHGIPFSARMFFYCDLNQRSVFSAKQPIRTLVGVCV